MTVSIRQQMLAVCDAAKRANESLTDAQLIWSEGDWRVQQIKKRFEHLSAAYRTLKAMCDEPQVGS